jgi:hypothetical protein
VIHDSFVDQQDRVLFLVDYESQGEWFWLTADQIKVSLAN